MRILAWLRRRPIPEPVRWATSHTIYTTQTGAYGPGWNAPTLAEGVPVLTPAQIYRGRGTQAS